ncbi:MAG: 50S ribosomal protein L6P, large subunit ribosomal protein L6 [Candidatus Moranbacteria bacterium GW2011_GWC1_45_18]|nr:MAG: 50S ribosomal protein L6 [Candidatus Moranbacteria bacterium GW2011_GWC2_40_12]KKT33881.1 MAG: 50S ribosomal protein L6 [Candidatus Moranbacteria bacterium GW2011_GWF2_44_10]KKT69641.1 MAG: 50S ribosomal protein L6 [Candidatus Moranbacteria bacterium GW2011_GWF1_44_4]KKT99781.1 MAG: 50S ribosomal protein L6P, large subunit ribosomal protein L6 [Candidatus Moranbacteria bacterium GW2011_GWC1_45_18]OGI23900.1 MAG: 50S ribosomal protein L6 [Candidatus Moranbacteria bacterium RIFOXYA1_FULL_
MSRIGKKSVAIPEGVEAKISGQNISIKGPKGSLDFDFHNDIDVKSSGKEIQVTAKRDTKQSWSLWGLTRMLIANMIQGVTKGYEKQLELQGVGFRMAVQGKKLNMALGFSHPVEVEVPEGLEAKIEKNILTISGIDKQKVGQLAASVRALKKVEPYKGKGFRYVGEIVRKKAGKKAVGADK